METLATVHTFLGWATVINLGVLLIATIMLTLARGFVEKIHSKLVNVPESDLPILYFNFLANYKVLTLIFFAVPYFAICAMSS